MEEISIVLLLCCKSWGRRCPEEETTEWFLKTCRSRNLSSWWHWALRYVVRRCSTLENTLFLKDREVCLSQEKLKQEGSYILPKGINQNCNDFWSETVIKSKWVEYEQEWERNSIQAFLRKWKDVFEWWN